MPVTLDAVGSGGSHFHGRHPRANHRTTSGDPVSPGDDVRKGQPLFVLDRRPLEAALRQAEAIVGKDDAQLRNAAAARQRAEDLLNKGILAPLSTTRASPPPPPSRRHSPPTAQVDQARLNLQYTQIASPLDGRTGALNDHVGDLVRTNDTLPLVTINQMAPIYVTFSVPARFLNDIRQARPRAADSDRHGNARRCPAAQQDTRSPHLH